MTAKFLRNTTSVSVYAEEKNCLASSSAYFSVRTVADVWKNTFSLKAQRSTMRAASRMHIESCCAMLILASMRHALPC